MQIQNIFVIGAGQMGTGIVQSALMAGYTVTMRDITEEIVKKGEQRITKNLEKLVQKGKLTLEEVTEMKSKLFCITELSYAANADLVIEAAIENIDIKTDIFKQLEKITKPETIFATNTSSISITEIAAVTQKPEKVIGMHFFNPVPVMKLLEVTKGYLTSQQTVDAILSVGNNMKKVTIVALDKPGFIVNRMIDPMLNEAICLVEEGVGTPEDIDKGMKFGCNHPMGPLELCDLIGLDVLLAVMEVFYKEYGDSKYRPATLLRKMVRAGKLGRKTGEGFYKYE